MAIIIPHTTRATGTVLTALIYNTDHQNHITNANSLNAEVIQNTADIAALGGGTGDIAGASLTLTSSDPGAGLGPTIILYRDSVSPAAADAIGNIDFNGEDSSGVATVYARLQANILDPTNGSADGELRINGRTAGLFSTFAVFTGAGMNSTPIGATTPSTGAFTTLSISNTLNSNLIYAGASFQILANTADAADTSVASFAGGGAVSATRGGNVIVYGNENGVFPGDVRIVPGLTGDIRLEGIVLAGTGGDIASAANSVAVFTNAGPTSVSLRNSTANVESYWDIGAVAASIGTLGANDFSLFTNNTNRLTIAGVGGAATFSSTISTAAGGASVPAYSFSSDPNTGFYSFDADEIGITTGGGFRANFTASGLNVGNSLQDATNPGVSLATDGQIITAVASDTNFIVNRTTTSGTMFAARFNNVSVGTLTTDGTGFSLTSASDARLKKNFRPFESGRIIDKLAFGQFEWISDDKTGYGVLAQDAFDAFPQAVFGNDEDGYQVDYTRYIPVAMAELKSLRKRVAILEEE